MPAIGPLLEPAPIVVDRDEDFAPDDVDENEPPVEAVGPLVEAALSESHDGVVTVDDASAIEPPPSEPMDLLDTAHAPWLADPELGVAWRESWVASQAEAAPAAPAPEASVAPGGEVVADEPEALGGEVVPDEPPAPPAATVTHATSPAPTPAPPPDVPTPLPPRRYEPRTLDRAYAATHTASRTPSDAALPRAQRWRAAPEPAPEPEPAAPEPAPTSARRPWWIAVAAGLVLGVLVGVAAYALGPGRDDVQVARFRVPVPELPAALEGLRIAHLSDLMLPRSAAAVARAAEAVAREQPDIVVLTGDLLDGTDAGALGARATDLAKLAGRVATFAVAGEHDLASGATRAQLRDALARQGITLLDGETRAVTVGKGTLHVVAAGGEDAGAVRALHRALPRGATAVWLTHAPGWLATGAGAPVRDAALVLAGHTRGGQVRLPFTDGLLPDGSAPYVSGWYEVGRAALYVSTGIGTAGVPARLLSPPGVAILTLGRARIAGESPTRQGATR